MSIDKKLIEVGQACIDYWIDIGDCHFCNTNLKFEHDDDCVLLEILGREYLDNLLMVKDILE